MRENAQKPEEQAEERQTITAKETFTLAKDVYDIRTVIKKIYANRAVITRRLNIVSLIIGVIFTLIYITYAVFSGLADKLSLGFGIVSIVLVAAYAVVVAGCIIVASRSGGVKTKDVRRVNKFLRILRYTAKILSLAISIACLVLSITSGSSSAAAIAVDTIMIIISIIVIILQTIPLIFGGIGGIARWLLSPVKRKVRFSAVALEWYQLAADDSKDDIAQVRVSKKYIDEAGAVLDGALIPVLGKKYIANITAEDLLGALDGLGDERLLVGEGALKSIFDYAHGCGYISENPCDKLNFSGDINEDGPRKTGIKRRLVSATKKAGMSFLDGMLSADDK